MDVIIHIGQQKTASSTIQRGLQALAGPLAAQGVLYSQAFGARKARHIKDVLLKKDRVEGNHDEITAAFRKEVLEGDGIRKVVISNENLFTSGVAVIESLRRLIQDAGGTPQIHLYVRRPVDHIVSRYQQRVRSAGQIVSLHDYAERMIGEGLYSYFEKMEQWRETFGREALHVRLFHRQTIHPSPLENFLEWIGVGLDPVVLEGVKHSRTNESFDPIGVEVARWFRRYLRESGGDSEGLIYGVLRRLRRLNTDERLAPDARLARRITKAFGKDSEQFAKAYLTDREAALLLEPPVTVEARPIEPREVVERTFAVFREVDPFIAVPQAAAEPDAPPPALDEEARTLLSAAEEFAKANPRRLSQETLDRLRRLLAERPRPEPSAALATPHVDEEDAEEGEEEAAMPMDDAAEARYRVFVRLMSVCADLRPLAQAKSEAWQPREGSFAGRRGKLLKSLVET